MARVLVKKDNWWYEQLASLNNYYEVEIEDRVLRHANETFKGYIVLPFKITIVSAVGSARPDLVFIREDYSDWFIIEVELYDHPQKHPEIQVNVFLDAKYDQNVVFDYLVKKKKDLDEAKMKKLVSSVQPKVMVIVDSALAPWIETFRKKGVLVCIFEVFKSTEPYELYRINGDYPYIIREKTHLINLGPPGDNFEFHDPNFIAENHGEEVFVYYRQSELVAKVLVQKNRKFLVIRNSPIPERKALVIGRDINGKYIIDLN